MPHLRIRGLSDSAVQDLSRSLVPVLAKNLNITEEHFTVEKIMTTFYRQGSALKDTEADPMIEFLWFDRGPEMRHLAAQKVTEQVRVHSKSESIAVVFVRLPKDHYYENGQHF